MGAQQAFQWAMSHPGFVDQVVAYCGTAKTYPHGVVRLEGAISALAADAAFADGNYTAPPRRGPAAWSQHWAAWVSQEWWRRELFKPRWPTIEAVLDERTSRDAVRAPNNRISQARTWQRHNVGDTPGFNATRSARCDPFRHAFCTCRAKPTSTFRSAMRGTKASSSRPSTSSPFYRSGAIPPAAEATRPTTTSSMPRFAGF
jgi:hypothetical protein